MDVIEDIIHQIGQSTGNVTNLYIQNISIVPLPFLLISAYLPALRKLSLNLGIYPPQNLYQRLSSFDIERIAAYEDDLQRMGETYNDELARIEETLLVPPYIASEYMVGVISLVILTMCLITHFLGLTGEGSSQNDQPSDWTRSS